MRFLEPFAPKFQAALRIVSGLLFMEHGTQKLFQFPIDPTKPPEPLVLFSLHGFEGVLEFVGAILIVLGLFTRPVAFLLSGEMAIGYWMVHFHRGPYPVLNGGDPAILFCFIFLYLAAAGGGDWSLDSLLGKRKAV